MQIINLQMTFLLDRKEGINIQINKTSNLGYDSNKKKVLKRSRLVILEEVEPEIINK